MPGRETENMYIRSVQPSSVMLWKMLVTASRMLSKPPAPLFGLSSVYLHTSPSPHRLSQPPVPLAIASPTHPEEAHPTEKAR